MKWSDRIISAEFSCLNNIPEDATLIATTINKGPTFDTPIFWFHRAEKPIEHKYENLIERYKIGRDGVYHTRIHELNKQGWEILMVDPIVTYDAVFIVVTYRRLKS